MARRYIFTNSLSSGELAPEYLMRTDTAVRGEGAKTFRNALLMAGGGFKRRWGTTDLSALPGRARLETIGVGADDAMILCFSSGKFQVFDLDGIELFVSTVGMPWSGADLVSMQVAVESNRVVVCSQSFFPRLLTYDPVALTWSSEELPFADGLNSASTQPYWRYAAKGISLTPSANTGSITLTADAAVFTTDHIGVKFRYVGIEVLITAVTSATVATGTVVGTLYPTLNCTVGSSAGFIVGQVVAGDTTQIQGVVSAVPDGTHVTVQMLDGYTAFDTTEALVGPTAKSTMSASASTTLAASVEWDEAMISAARGYPGACALHGARLLLGNFPNAQNAMAASTTGDITNFDTGSGLDTDAIIEVMGRENSLGLKHFGSHEQLLMFTESGPFYVPEQVAAPLSPTHFEILRIGPEAAGEVAPLVISEGMLFSENLSGRVMIAAQTGNVRRSWEISDLSELGFHLMGTPVELELLAAGTEADRLVFQLRDDGQMSVLTYRRGAQSSAWGLWTTTGSWVSMVAAAGTLYLVAKRTINSVVTYRLEKFDPTAYGDGTVSLAALTTPCSLYASSDVTVWDGTANLGASSLSAAGVLEDIEDTYTAVQVGLDFTTTVAVVPPIDPEKGLNDKIRICRVDVDCISSVGFKVNGYDSYGWIGAIGGDVGPDSSVRRFRLLGGRSRDATATLVQDVGGPLEVRSITMEVTS